MPATPFCPECGLILPGDALGGLCPQCLLRQGLDAAVARPATTVDQSCASDRPVVAGDWHIGDRLQNRWEVREIFKGGMGAVYVVYDLDSREILAAKTYRDDKASAGVAERFRREALAWVKLDAHPNITRAHLVETIAGKPYVFMDYVDGDLGKWIGRRLTGNLPQVLRYALQFCDGMIHALAKGIRAHRDIKPQNCLITHDQTLQVSDFGLATALDDPRRTAEEPGSAAGTLRYMAPEQFDGIADARSDVYSFGIMLYEMITGSLPFVARERREYERIHKTQPPPTLCRDDFHLNELIQKCLAKNPGDRFADFREVRERLAAAYCKFVGRPVPEPIAGAALDARQWIDKGYNLKALGLQEQALACYERALTINPHDIRGWSNKGALLQALERPQESLACYDRALSLDPQHPHVLANKGLSLALLGRHREAIPLLERALTYAPARGDHLDWAKVNYVLGCCWLELAKTDRLDEKQIRYCHVKGAAALRRAIVLADPATPLTSQQRVAAQTTLAHLDRDLTRSDPALPEKKRRSIYADYVSQRETARRGLGWKEGELAKAAFAQERSDIVGKTFAQAESFAAARVLRTHRLEQSQLQAIIEEGLEKEWAWNWVESRWPEDLLRQHLSGMKKHYAGSWGFEHSRPYWDRLLEPDAIRFTVLTMKEQMRLSLMDQRHNYQARLFGDLYVAVSTIPIARPEKARAYFPLGYSKFLDQLMDECLYGAGDVCLAHWILCSEADEHMVHLTFMPDWQTVRNHQPCILVMAQDLMTAAERARGGIH